MIKVQMISKFIMAQQQKSYLWEQSNWPVMCYHFKETFLELFFFVLSFHFNQFKLL